MTEREDRVDAAIQAFLDYLEGTAERPSPDHLTEAERREVEEIMASLEAARGMGMRPRQVFASVEFPLALPLLFAGIRTASVYVVATATLAAIAGGGGLGEIIVDQASYKLSGVLAASIWVAALALLVDVALGGVQWLLTPRGLRRKAPVVGATERGTRPDRSLRTATGTASQ